jgi:hypothetical protein
MYWTLRQVAEEWAAVFYVGCHMYTSRNENFLYVTDPVVVPM